MTEPLLPHQQENVEWMRRVKRGLLADDPGLGKSRSALAAFDDVDSVLVIAPKMVLDAGVWQEEISKWGNPNIKYDVVPYTQLYPQKDKGVLRPEFNQTKYDAVIIDEAHYIKGRGTRRTAAVRALANKAERVVLLTGTPIPNWAYEAFTLLQVVYPEKAKPGGEFGSFWRWAELWFDISVNHQTSTGAKQIGGLRSCTVECGLRNVDDPCSHYREFAKRNFGDRYLRHGREDHLDLPPIDVRDVATPMDSATRAAYSKLRADFVADVNGTQVIAWSTGAKHVMLDRITTSPWLLNPVGAPMGGKLDRLATDLRLLDEPVLVLAHYRQSVEAAVAVARSVGKSAEFIHGEVGEQDRFNRISRFRSGKLDVLVGSLETLAEGLQLTVASTAIFLERSYKPSRNTQATYRIHRLGQNRPCTVIRYLTPDSVDSGKERLLRAKTDQQMRVLSAADFASILDG